MKPLGTRYWEKNSLFCNQKQPGKCLSQTNAGYSPEYTCLGTYVVLLSTTFLCQGEQVTYKHDLIAFCSHQLIFLIFFSTFGFAVE